MGDLVSDCCSNCKFGAGIFYGCDVMNCMNAKSFYIHLIVTKDFKCDHYEPKPKREDGK